MVFGLALVMTLVLGAATMAFGADGQSWILGQINRATATTQLSGNAPGKPALQVVNPNTARGSRALQLGVASGKAPLAVNAAAGKATNLNADKVDGQEASAFAGTGMSRYTSTVFLDGCDEKVLASSTISPSRPALVFASGASVYDSNSAPIQSGVLELELRDATNTTTLASGGYTYVPGAVPDSEGSYHVPLSFQGLLMSGSDAFNSATPFEVTPGNSYVLRLLGSGTDGNPCTGGHPVMDSIVLSYVLIGK